jgi:hypothetical protein
MLGPRRRSPVAALATGVLACLALVLPTAAQASSQQVTLFSDNGRLQSDPAGTLQRLRLLGVQEIRLFLPWNTVAPHPLSRSVPRHFDAGNPAAYPQQNWRQWDAIIADAADDGISVDLDLAGGAPLWATGPGAPPNLQQAQMWDPDARAYGAFVHAVGERYAGDYSPSERRADPDAPDDLPAVHTFSVWNEPNYGPSLAPQGLPGAKRVEHSPAEYRSLVDAAWSALGASGHRDDTFLWGELAPRGARRWGLFSGMKPLIFLRALFCVDGAYRPLRGLAATERGCSASPLAPVAFRRAHPGLFAASGVSDHPYMRWYAPGHEATPDPNYSSLGTLGNLERGLDRLQALYGSPRRLPIFDTEFGYITSPPKRDTAALPWITQATAALYLNEAEYLSWRNPRVASYDQYLLYDPERPTAANAFGGFASGLLSWNGQQKLTYLAFRDPLYLPRTIQSRQGSLEVWGAVRAAYFAQQDTGQNQSVQIQLAPGTSRRFRTVDTFLLSNPQGYFDTRVHFPRSGTVRLFWAYPSQDAELAPGYPTYSRQVSVTVR